MGGRDLAVGMSRWDRSPVGNGCSAGVPKPLQGRDASPRIARIKRVSAERVCGNVTVWTIWSAAVHRRFFDGANEKKSCALLQKEIITSNWQHHHQTFLIDKVKQSSCTSDDSIHLTVTNSKTLIFLKIRK